MILLMKTSRKILLMKTFFCATRKQGRACLVSGAIMSPPWAHQHKHLGVWLSVIMRIQKILDQERTSFYRAASSKLIVGLIQRSRSLTCVRMLRLFVLLLCATPLPLARRPKFHHSGPGDDNQCDRTSDSRRRANTSVCLRIFAIVNQTLYISRTITFSMRIAFCCLCLLGTCPWRTEYKSVRRWRTDSDREHDLDSVNLKWGVRNWLLLHTQSCGF